MAVNSPIFQAIISFFYREGINPIPLIESAGFSSEELLSGDLPRFIEITAHLWEHARSRANDATLYNKELFPFHAGRNLLIEQLGAIGFVIRNSSTLGEAFHYLGQHNAIFNELVCFSPFPEEGYFKLNFQFKPIISAHVRLLETYVLLEFGYLLGGLSQLVGQPIGGIKLRAQLSEELASALAGTIQAEVLRVPNTPEVQNSLWIPLEALAYPVLLPNLQVKDFFLPIAEQEQQNFLRKDNYSERLKVIFFQEKGHFPTLLLAAKELGISPRVLQRKLKTEGTTYKVLGEEVRKALAHRYLKAGKSILETATLLGYNDASAFSRAFKQWHGFSPKAAG